MFVLPKTRKWKTEIKSIEKWGNKNITEEKKHNNKAKGDRGKIKT